MKTIERTEIELETTYEIFYCPVDPEDKNSELVLVTPKGQNLDDSSITTKEAAEKLDVSEKFLIELLNAFDLAIYNASEDLISCWQRIDELEKRIEELEKK